VNLDSLRRALPDRRIDYYPSVDSTMRAAATLPRGSIVIADEQTAGQGRHGHSWHSAPNIGIYCSIVLDPAPALTLTIGLATVEAIAEATGIACDLRWPNDVMLDGKKCAGILVQLIDGKAIAGIGINVNHTEFPPDLATEATSLRMHRHAPTPDPRPLTPILASLLPAVDRYAALPLEQILDLFTNASSYVSGRRVVVNEIHGVTAGLDPAGFLKVRQDDGTVTLILAGGVRAAP
jgi:BirA family transcriptional regulator, biotin operon repressor / biotin---[acetyl-CoA-carboxylase] ligase